MTSWNSIYELCVILFVALALRLRVVLGFGHEGELSNVVITDTGYLGINKVSLIVVSVEQFTYLSHQVLNPGDSVDN